MTSESNPPVSAAGEIPTRDRRPWPIKALSWLLLLQAAMFGLIAAFHTQALRFDLRLTQEEYLANLPFGLRGLVFLALALLCLSAAAGFFRLWPAAWFNAVFAQGLSLLMALYLYFHERPFYCYAIMIYGIWMVVYLNYTEVRAVFHSEREAKDWGGMEGA
jgi:hypothetical protein